MQENVDPVKPFLLSNKAHLGDYSDTTIRTFEQHWELLLGQHLPGRRVRPESDEILAFGESGLEEDRRCELNWRRLHLSLCPWHPESINYPYQAEHTVLLLEDSFAKHRHLKKGATIFLRHNLLLGGFRSYNDTPHGMQFSSERSLRPMTTFHRFGRSILYIPIGQLSSQKIKKLRVVHVLDSYARRQEAKQYIW